MRRAASVVTAALVLALVLAGCDGDDASPPAAGGAATTTTGTTAAPASTAAPGTATTAAASTAPAACTASTFLPILKRRLDGSSPKLRIVRAEVRRCRNGYAQVFAVPDQSVCQPGVGYCYESEQVFLGRSGGTWRILTTGTGITCEGETDAQVRRICQALGYPG